VQVTSQILDKNMHVVEQHISENDLQIVCFMALDWMRLSS